MGVYRQPPRPAQRSAIVAILFPAGVVEVFPPSRRGLSQQALAASRRDAPFIFQQREVPIDALDLYTQAAPIGKGDVQSLTKLTLRSNVMPFQRKGFLFPQAPVITGTVNYTNANDTLSASGSPVVSGTLATTNANDTLAAAGSPVISGSLAKTNADDTLVASGSVGNSVTGTVNYTNANDTLAASGSPVISGSLSVTNANDTIAASGTPVVIGSSATTNANDTLVAAGVPGSVTGSASITNANDTLAASGYVGAYVAPNNSPNDSSRRRKAHSSIYTVQERGQKAHDKAIVKAAITEAEARPAIPKAIKANQTSPVDQAQEAAYIAALQQLENDDEDAFSLIMELV